MCECDKTTKEILDELENRLQILKGYIKNVETMLAKTRGMIEEKKDV